MRANGVIVGYKNHLFGQGQWSQDLNQLVARVKAGKSFRMVSHFQESLEKRGLSMSDVFSVFRNGTAEIIQGHAPGTFPFSYQKINEDELRVVYGKLSSGKVIHIVIAIHSQKLITVYFPQQSIFEADQKTLRPQFAFRPIYQM